MADTFTLIASSTVGAGGASSIDFTSIPSTYTDLVVKFSVRSDNTTSGGAPSMLIKLNTLTTNFTYRIVYGDGSTAASSSGSTGYVASTNNNNTGTSTANTFTSGEVYIPNYAGSTNKSMSIEGVSEHNGTTAYAVLNASLWSNTAAINAIGLYYGSGSFMQYSTAYLYGVKNA